MNNPGIQEETDNDTINLLDYLHVVAKRSRMIIRVTGGAFVLAIIVSLLMPNIYTSTAKILPPQQDQSLAAMMMGQMAGGTLGNIAGGLLGGSTPADTYATVLDSDDIKDAVIDKFKLMDVYDIDKRDAMYKKLDNLVQIDAGKKDGVISISVEDKKPKRAAAIAEIYLSELSKRVAEMNAADDIVNGKYLEKRLAEAKANLSAAEEKMKAFQLKNKVIDVPSQAQATIGGLADMQGQLVVQESQLAALRSRFTDSNQQVIDAKSAISSLKQKIAQMEGTGSGSPIISVGSAPQLGEEYIRLLREYKIQEAIVDILTKQYELARLNESKKVTSIQVVQYPHVPDKKTKPKRSLIVLGVTFVSFFFAVFMAFLMEYVERMPEEEKMRWKELRGYLLCFKPGFVTRIMPVRWKKKV